MGLLPIILALLALATGKGETATGGFQGPGRFCGYSPIIDLLPDERIEPLQGGIHSGTFRWVGGFGTLEVHGVGWASRPPGRMLSRRTSKGERVFAQTVRHGRYSVAIWNGAQGAAYFSSPRALTPEQLAAVQRVELFQEGQQPDGCKYRIIFAWD